MATIGPTMEWLHTIVEVYHTSYEMSPKFLPKKDPVVKAFEDLTINTQKRTPSLFVKLLGSAKMGRSFLEYETASPKL